MDGSVRARMNQTGIGFAGIDGVWWLPAIEPFALPVATRRQLERIAAALFLFLDVLADQYRAGDRDLVGLLDFHVPARVPRLFSPAPVLMLRPDFQLVEQDGGYRLVATELEMCPAAQGFAHAMQVGYGLETDLTDAMAAFLNGRPLLFAGTSQWSEFLFEQLAFCRALAERGAEGYVLYDEPLGTIDRSVREGRRWQPPMFGVKTRPPGWRSSVIDRIAEAGLDDFRWPDDEHWPADVGDAVIFRFGYLECFTPTALDAFARWASTGATFLNPLTTYLESKVVLAALGLPAVRQRLAGLSPEALAVLDKCLPETRLLRDDDLSPLLAEKDGWITKYAGFDGDNQAWGGRSLHFGRDHDATNWERLLREASALPWPVVAQRLAPSARVNMGFLDDRDEPRQLQAGHTRLRTFLLRMPDGTARACGSHLTVSASAQVSEATDSVQAPVRFDRS